MQSVVHDYNSAITNFTDSLAMYKRLLGNDAVHPDMAKTLHVSITRQPPRGTGSFFFLSAVQDTTNSSVITVIIHLLGPPCVGAGYFATAERGPRRVVRSVL